MDSRDSFGRGTTGTLGTELLLILLLSSPAHSAQNSAAGRPAGGGHADMRPTKLWLCIREFYVEQITIVSYDWFHYDQSHSDRCCWHPGLLRIPSKEKSEFRGSEYAYYALSELIIFVWIGCWCFREWATIGWDCDDGHKPTPTHTYTQVQNGQC